MVNHCRFLALICSTSLLWGCGDEPSIPANNTTDLDQIYTYIKQIPESPQRDPASCVNYSRSCSVAELPFIAMSYPDTTIEQVMSRVVVSHDWMGERFATLLTILPDELLTLLGSVTAIVIADNIRPSFYWTGSGAIYLDPAWLWLTNQEKQTIDQTEDYRDAFSNGLSYNFFHRFVKDNQPAYSNYSLTGSTERTIDEIVIPMASLLFHELAHANDFMPSSLMPSIDISQSTLSQINRFTNVRLNVLLQQNYPLSNEALKKQAAVLYLGQPATEQQKLATADELAVLFEQEGSNHLYAYSRQAEDVAMLFQETMLNYYYHVEMDSTFVIQPEIDSNYCDDYIIAWGQRNRIADPISKPRAQFVAQHLLSAVDFSTFFNELKPAQLFPSLINWCNISLTEPVTFDNFSRAAQKSPIGKLKKDHHHGVFTTFK